MKVNRSRKFNFVLWVGSIVVKDLLGQAKTPIPSVTGNAAMFSQLSALDVVNF
jgi:hypothetical protein